MGDNKLHTAVRYGNEEETLQALKEGFSPNELGMLRWSPVHEASHNGERDILKMLLLFKGDVNQQDGLHGNTPLHYAAQEDNSACVTVLLNAGAKLDIKNDQGRTPLDIATSSCLERMEPFINNSQNTTGEDWQPGSAKAGKAPGIKDQTRWQGLDDVPSNAAIGSLHLSFEFHKSALKVRVWQITDLLLPPPQTSMIESIFVRGFFIPDAAKKSQRKTEDVLVDPTTSRRDSTRRRSSRSPPRGGIQHIFTPSSFRFDTPLLYTGVTEEMVSQRSIQLEVCMTQKHTHKPFLMAMVHMPLRTAVRRPIREKYPLIPCMNLTIPNSMRVYSAKDIFIEGTSQVAPPIISRSNSLQSNPDSTHSNSSLDNPPSTLQDVRIDSRIVPAPFRGRKLISVNMSGSCDEDTGDNDKEEINGDEDVDDGIGSLDVKICSGKGSAASSVTVDVLDTSLNDYEMNNTSGDDHLKDVVIHKTGSSCSGFGEETSVVVVDMGNIRNSLPHGEEERMERKKKKKRIIPNELISKSTNDDDDDDDDEGDDERVVNNNNNNVDKEINNVLARGENSRRSRRSEVDVESTIIEVEEPTKETVVDMTRLTGDAIVDMDMMTDSGYDNESVKSETTSPVADVNNKELTSGSKRKKRIIPNEMRNENRVEGEDEGEEEEKENDDIVISEPNKMILIGDEAEEEEDDDDEISRETNPTRLLSSSSQLSTESSSKDKSSSTPIAGSRPETPVWDFYDFACTDNNNAAGHGGDQSSQSSNHEQSNSNSTTKVSSSSSFSADDPSCKSSTTTSSSTSTATIAAAASTLQESLARLSRPQPVLDTCHVSGPVLPSIIIMDDFEMDNDDDDDS